MNKSDKETLRKMMMLMQGMDEMIEHLVENVGILMVKHSLEEEGLDSSLDEIRQMYLTDPKFDGLRYKAFRKENENGH